MVIRTKSAYEICLRLNETEARALKEKARLCGISRSAFLRRLIMGKTIKARPPEALHDLYVEINRIGVNVNQIARACNAGGSDARASADKALFMLGKVYALMDRLAAG